MIVTTSSAAETAALARTLSAFLQAGDVLALDGDLGAGKTTFVQGLARGLGSPENATSPTFVLMRIYRGRLPIYHFDVYRIEQIEELDDIGAEEYFWGDGVAVVEWADRIVSALPSDRLEVRFESSGLTQRKIHLSGHGPRHQDLCTRLSRALEACNAD